jgi:uncharacterized protein (DUF736 family)
MAYEQKDNSGSLFKNDRMTSDKSPEYKGTVLIDGVEYWQSAWVKTTKDGRKFFSQSFNRKDAAPAATQRAADPVEMSDDVPF